MKNLNAIALIIITTFALVGALCAHGTPQQILSLGIFTLAGILCTIHIYNIDKD
jgi:hypothetical protein